MPFLWLRNLFHFFSFFSCSSLCLLRPLTTMPSGHTGDTSFHTCHGGTLRHQNSHPWLPGTKWRNKLKTYQLYSLHDLHDSYNYISYVTRARARTVLFLYPDARTFFALTRRVWIWRSSNSDAGSKRVASVSDSTETYLSNLIASRTQQYSNPLFTCGTGSLAVCHPNVKYIYIDIQQSIEQSIKQAI